MKRKPLRIVVLGLSLSSSWGNGHATTYRALLKALAARGHDIVFLERETPWYAANRDLAEPGYCRLGLYRDVNDLMGHASQVIAADVVVVGSYVPDGIAVGDWVLATAGGLTAFYDIDTPVTLAAIERGDCAYLGKRQIPRYGLYLSFTGGPILQALVRRHGARSAHALFCSVEIEAFRPRRSECRWALGYLGTYSPDRQPTLERLLLQPAHALPHMRFVVAGAQFPTDIAWPANVERIDHVAPAELPAFFSSQRWTLNVTRAEMITAGWSPSVRLFEAAASGAPIISDAWPGLESLLEPGREIVIATQATDIMAALTLPQATRDEIAAAARRRVVAEHSSHVRARQLEEVLLGAIARGGSRHPSEQLEASGIGTDQRYLRFK